jgi:hypothetical protein
MEGRQKPYMEKHKAIKNYWNCDASSVLTSLLALDAENFKYLVFVVQNVHF